MTGKILAFKGLRYNQDKIPALADVVTPPYDVISSDMQDEFYKRSPMNFCRVDFPKEEGEQRYKVVKELYQKWLNDRVFIQDDKPSVYIHHHTFTLPDGRKVTRKGFLAARRVEDFSEGGVKPHEKTLDGPKQDRLSMTHATQCNLSPVFSLYADPDLSIEKKFVRTTETTPIVDFVSHDQERHQLWRLTDEKLLNELDATLSERPLFIADGHHRYETSINYRNEMRANNPNHSRDAASEFIMMYFSNLNDDGLVILPIHRALHGVSGLTFDSLVDKLKPYFEVQPVDGRAVQENLSQLSELGENQHAFWIISRDEHQSCIVSLNRTKWLGLTEAQGIPDCLKSLDVTVLHQLVFKHILGMTEESQAKQENLIYWKSTERAISETVEGNCDLTFILNPTRVEDVQRVAGAGEKMPQKSTYFYPKIVSGLVLHSVSEEERDGLNG